MAYCYNCGVQIPDGDKMKLCERCKKILLPFIKFMDASTSPAVRRLMSNERNLRNAGVTDSGMEYLLRLCELHDQKRKNEREEREAAKVAENTPKIDPYKEIPVREEVVRDVVEEVELPVEEPLHFCKSPYGKGLTFGTVVLWLTGFGLLAWFAVQIILFGELEVGSLIGAISSFAGASLAGVVRKLHHDLHELKKKFK